MPRTRYYIVGVSAARRRDDSSKACIDHCNVKRHFVRSVSAAWPHDDVRDLPFLPARCYDRPTYSDDDNNLDLPTDHPASGVNISQNT